jgi:DNA segregation ATPase FtsK/SpoIIIE, S-DNA-T family
MRIKGGEMSFQTIIRHKPRMTEEHLSNLTDELEAHGCRVRRDWLWTQLYVDLPNELEAWLKTGGLEAVLANRHQLDGRSLGVHLLLASQRLDEGKLRGLESHLSYRVGLRTFSAMESRTVLGVPDAYQLPRSPGNGFLKTEADTLTRFRAAYVSGRHNRGVVIRTGDDGRRVEPIQDYSTKYLVPQVVEEPEAAEPAPEEEETEVGETLLDVLVGRMEGQGKPAHQVWLPPLAAPPTLDQLVGPLALLPGRGLTSEDTGRHGRLRAVAGVIDKPYEQRRDTYWLDLSEGSGNVAVVGGPRSG